MKSPFYFFTAKHGAIMVFRIFSAVSENSSLTFVSDGNSSPWTGFMGASTPFTNLEDGVGIEHIGQLGIAQAFKYQFCSMF